MTPTDKITAALANLTRGEWYTYHVAPGVERIAVETVTGEYVIAELNNRWNAEGIANLVNAARELVGHR